MTIYTTYFNSPVQVGKCPDNSAGDAPNGLQAVAYGGIGDVVLSQALNLPITQTGTTTAWVLLPINADLQSINFTSISGALPTAGTYTIQPTQADGTGGGPIQTVALSTTAAVTSVAFGTGLAGVYRIPAVWRLQFVCTVTVTQATGTPQIIAEVTYAIRT